MKIEKQETTEYLEKMKDIRLSDSSRTRIEQGLLEYARFHPVEEGVRVGEDGRFIGQVPPSTSLIKRILNFKLQPMTALVLMIALAVGGGTTYAAEGSVPGDLLYPVKLEVNESIKSGVALSNRSEAALQARLAEERLKEAEILAAEGRLTVEAANELSARVKNHYEEAEARNQAAEANGDYESSATTRASLEGTFRTYADVLNQLNVSVSGNNGASLINDISGYADTSADAQATATAEVSLELTSTISATVDRAETIVNRAEAEMEDVRSELSAAVAAQVDAKIVAAVSAKTNARASLDNGEYREAYEYAQKAISLATQAETMHSTTVRVEGGIDFGTGLDSVIKTSPSTSTDEAENVNSTSSTDTDVMLDIDVNAETGLDTEVLDVRLESDTSVGSGLRL